MSCRFSEPSLVDGDEPVLKCHRYPPVLLVFEGEPTQAVVQVTEDDWCGEWQAERGPYIPLGGDRAELRQD